MGAPPAAPPVLERVHGSGEGARQDIGSRIAEGGSAGGSPSARRWRTRAGVRRPTERRLATMSRSRGSVGSVPGAEVGQRRKRADGFGVSVTYTIR